MKCLNCGNEFEGKFCSECGQKSTVRRLNIKDISKEVPNSIFNLEQRFWRTIVAIFRNPYELSKSYSAGQRKTYAPPFQLYFFFATVCLILEKILGLRNPGFEVTQETDEMGEKTLEIYERFVWAADKFTIIVEDYSNYFEIGLPLMFGLVLALFVRKRMNLAETITFSFFIFTVAYYLPFLIFLPFRTTSTEGNIESGVTLLLVSWFTSYVGKRRVLNFFLGFLISILAFFAYALLFVVVLILLYPALAN